MVGAEVQEKKGYIATICYTEAALLARIPAG